MNNEMLRLYEHYVRERHHVWAKRQFDLPQPWTSDAVLQRKKFTNDFRVLDPGSQYVVKMLQEPGLAPADALARCLLYRYTNRPETWDYLKRANGRWPMASDMDGHLANLLCKWRDQGERVFSGAYIILPAPNQKGDKVRQAVALVQRLTHPQSPENVVQAVLGAGTPRGMFDALTANYGVGPFMAMQVLTDYGYYDPSWDENEFVIAGPGSRRGIAHLDRVATPEQTILWARNRLWDYDWCPTLGTEFGTRALSLMDVQNTFCEFSKYVRYLSKPLTGTGYRPAHPGEQPEPVLPLHW